MSLRYFWSPSVGVTEEITAYCRLYRYSATTDAKEGSVAHSSQVVDDPDGIFNFTGHRRFWTTETLASASNQLVHNGYIFGEKVSRGPYRTGKGRIWTLDIADSNVLMNRRVMNGTDANRQAETDVERMEALMGIGGTPMAELSNVEDTLYFSTVSPVAMDAVDYRTQFPGPGYIDDCAQASGKNYFVWYREATGEDSLWYDFAASSNWSSTIRLSNVLSDVDDTTTFAIDLEQEAEMDRDPSRVASGVMLPFDGVAVGSNTVKGTVYVQNQDTADEFTSIDWVAPSINVKSKAKALARGNRYLADMDEEDDLIHCSVKLPAAKVNAIYAGMRVEAKFSHFPGYEDFTWMRCLSRTVNEISEDPTRAYRLDLELSPLAPLVAPAAVMWRAQTDDDYPAYVGVGIYPIAWRCAGDHAFAECSGYPIEPTVGPLTPIVGNISDPHVPPSTGPVGNYLGYTFEANGTVDIHATFQVFGALDGVSQQVDLLLDGVIWATGTGTSGVPTPTQGCIIEITETGLEVTAGSVLTGQYTHGGSAAFYLDTPLGDETSSELRITGGSLLA